MFKSEVKTKPEHDKIPQLALVTLTRRNKKRLFHDSIETCKNSIEKTEALLARLERFDRSTAQEFGFKDVAVSQAPFRLLCSVPTRTKAIRGLKNIFGGFEVENSKPYWMSSSSSDTQFNSFIALSYCWHNQNWTPAPGCQPLEGWPISSMMLQALLNQRQSPDEGIWIDACCIDQSNETEKMHAVGSMEVVYKSARLVVIILEDVYLHEIEADEVRMVSAEDQNRNFSIRSLPSLSHGLPRILSSRWFTRAWCSHEFQLGSNSLFLVPTESGLVQLTMTTLFNLYPLDQPNSSLLSHIPLREFETMFRSYMFRNIDWYRRTPMAQFKGIINLKSTVETDKIGIAVNIAGFQLYFTGSTKSPHQCRWILAMLALSAGDVTSLCGSEITIKVSSESNQSSWLRWNADSENFVASLSAPTFPRRSDITYIDPSHIILDLYVLEHCTPYNPSTDSTLRATNFLNRYFDGIERKPMWMELKQGQRKCKIEALACSLDCGLAWLAENIIFNPDVAVEMQWKMELTKFDFWPVIADLLIDRYPAEESVLSNFTDEQKRSVSLYIYFVMTTLERPTSLSSYDSGMLESYENAWAWLDLGTIHAKALMPSLSGKFAECRFAVPAALAGPTCATMDRLWLLRPQGSATNSEWSIVEKTQIVTFRPLERDGGNIIHRTKQTIRG
jgi:Heterokaryon incompatibility protein (HET)